MEALIDYNRFVCAQRTVIRSESFHSLFLIIIRWLVKKLENNQINPKETTS
jgi:hypothetical protein